MRGVDSQEGDELMIWTIRATPTIGNTLKATYYVRKVGPRAFEATHEHMQGLTGKGRTRLGAIEDLCVQWCSGRQASNG